MSDKLKPVCCGCGGEAEVISYLSREYCKMAYYVRCVECGTETDDLHTEAEAVQAWNRAMGAKDINVPNKFATDTNDGSKERTAKAEWSEVDGCHLCGECGFAVCPNCDVYCAGCGARLEWE